MQKSLLTILLFSFLALCAQIISAQVRLESSSAPRTGKGSGETLWRWRFENDRFTTPWQEIELDQDGHGKFLFKKKDSEEIASRLAVSKSVMEQAQSLMTELNFLSSAEDYQHKKDFSHLGNHTFTYSHDGRERTVKINYTDNQAMNRLLALFRNIAIQETRVMEIQAVRQSDPISTPNQMRYLETELKGRSIADPQQLIPLLEEIRLDESVPLIARNHADRLVKMIQKGK